MAGDDTGDDGEDLDKRYGAAASNDDLDPTHLRALAVRIQQLAGIIDLQRAEGRRRDDRIENVRTEVKDARRDIEKLDNDVAALIRQQFSEEHKKTLVAIMNNYTFKDRAWRVVFRYLGYASAVAAFFYMFREPIGRIITALGKTGP